MNIQFVDLEQILLKNDTEPLYLNNFMDHHLHNREGIRKINDIITNFIDEKINKN